MRKRIVQAEPAVLPSEIWDVEQVRAFLKIGRTKLYELINGGLPSRMIGGSRRFDPRDVARWWSEQKSA